MFFIVDKRFDKVYYYFVLYNKQCLRLRTMKQNQLNNFIEITKKEFQQYQPEPITTIQAIEIQNNLFGVVELLLQWSA